MIYADQDEVDAALDYWQGVLRLQDWDVKASIVRRDTLDGTAGEGVRRGGLVKRFSGKKEALIYILDPVDDVAQDRCFPLDHEYILVHELIHLHTRTIMDASEANPNDCDYAQWNRMDAAEEYVVDRLAKSFVGLRRESRGKTV